VNTVAIPPKQASCGERESRSFDVAQSRQEPENGVTDQEAAEDVSHLHLRQEEGWHHQLGGI
jgi:hypothetical protein